MTHDVIVALAALGVVGQVVVGVLVLLGLLRLAGLGRPLGIVQRAIWGYELWLAFLVAAVATGGSLFFSEVAHFVPCELCWFQRICMYPLSITTLLMALANDHRAVRYLLPLPVVGSDFRLSPARRERRRPREPGLPGLCARRLRYQVDQRVRLRDHPDACPHGIRPHVRVHAVLSLRAEW